MPVPVAAPFKAARLLRQLARIPPEGMSVVSVVYCQVDVSATG